MNQPRRHHFLPQFYLKGFTGDDGLLWVYDRERDEFRKQQPKDSAVQKDYYTYTDKDGVKHFDIEQMLSMVEGEASGPLAKLDAGDPISEDERSWVAQFIAFLMLRTPETEKRVNEMVDGFMKLYNRVAFPDVESVRVAFEKFSADTGTPLKKTPEEMFEFFKSEAFTVEATQSYRLKLFLESSMGIAPAIFGMHWLVLHAPNGKHFITTDAPFQVRMPTQINHPKWMGVGVLSPGAEKLLPLTKSTALVIAHPGQTLSHHKANGDAMRRFNLTLTRSAEEFVYARDETHVRNLVRTAKLPQRGPLTHIRFG